jgi:hypothetical protein
METDTHHCARFVGRGRHPMIGACQPPRTLYWQSAIRRVSHVWGSARRNDPDPDIRFQFSAMRLVPLIGRPIHAKLGAQLLIRLALRPSGPCRELSVPPGAGAALSARERQHEDDAHSETSRKPANP